MRQIERLDQLLSLLRARGNATMTDLAAELGVSVRTIRRDIDLLRERGTDIEGERGRGGGVRLARHATLAPIRLSEDEVVALYLSVELMRLTPGMPFAGSCGPALTKVLASLPESRRGALTTLIRRVTVGPAARKRVAASATPVDPMLLLCLERAFSERRCLAFEYSDRLGAQTTRTIEPHGLLCRVPVWYVLAHDLGKDEPRAFRLDRIGGATVQAQAFDLRPDLIRGMVSGLGGARGLMT